MNAREEESVKNVFTFPSQALPCSGSTGIISACNLHCIAPRESAKKGIKNEKMKMKNIEQKNESNAPLSIAVVISVKVLSDNLGTYLLF